ncbi:hypothetical protein JL720_5979 [Aureococcus anophagefferens]|nr:hypothetical protein JL720_5979 [Aureococcus anophagefferens]
MRPALLCALAMLCGCTGDSSVVEILQRREAAAAGAFGEPLAAIPIGTEDGGVAGDVKIYEGEEPVDAIAAFCVEAQLEPWFRKAITERVCAGGDFEALPPCARKRAVFFASEISVPDDPEGRTYPGKLVVMEDEAPAASVELFLAAAEKEITKNRTKWDKQHEAWEKNRTKNAAFAAEHAGVARKKDDRDRALREIDELDWLLDNHTLSEPMRPPAGWFRAALLEHVCGLPGLSCEGRRKPLPELPITVDGSGKPRGVVRPYEGDEGVDLAYLFGKQHDLTTDVFRESLMSYLCTVEGVSCTRTRARVFSRSPADVFGDPDMRFWINFEIWEDEEPVDAAFDYARRFQLTLEQRCALLGRERGDPIAFKFAVTEGAEKKGSIELLSYQRPADAVYDYCRKEKYLQPKYTRLHVRANLHASFCAALELDRGFLTDEERASCEDRRRKPRVAVGPRRSVAILSSRSFPRDRFLAIVSSRSNARAGDGGPTLAREERFKQEFTVGGLTYKMPFYDDEFPPCDGVPGPDGLEDGLWGDEVCTPRETRAALVFCERIVPFPPGCVEYLAPAIAASLLRAERRRFIMTSRAASRRGFLLWPETVARRSPFGYDYYLSMGELRDADNDTIVAAYLRGVEPLPAELEELTANLTALNASLAALEETHELARRSLARARAREVAMEAMGHAAGLLAELRAALAGSLVKNDRNVTPAQAIAEAADQFPPSAARRSRRRSRAGSRREAATDVGRADALLHAARDNLNGANGQHGDTQPRADHLETMSRVFKEGHETLTDKKRRETNDKPCQKIFGACCAKETDNGGKDIKCGGDFEDA